MSRRGFVLVQVIAAIAATVTLASCWMFCSELEHDATIAIRHPTGELPGLIARCTADSNDCDALCDATLRSLPNCETCYVVACTVERLGAGAEVQLTFNDGRSIACE